MIQPVNKTKEDNTQAQYKYFSDTVSKVRKKQLDGGTFIHLLLILHVIAQALFCLNQRGKAKRF